MSLTNDTIVYPTVQIPGTSSNFIQGSGDPNGSETQEQGSVYLRSDGGVGTTMYLKEAGGLSNTGWEPLIARDYGMIRKTSEEAVNITGVSVWINIPVGTRTLITGSNFVLQGGDHLRYTGAQSKRAFIRLIVALGDSNQTIQCRYQVTIGLNGGTLGNGSADQSINVGDTYQMISTSITTTLNTNDNINMRIRNLTNTEDPIIGQFLLMAYTLA